MIMFWLPCNRNNYVLCFIKDTRYATRYAAHTPGQECEAHRRSVLATGAVDVRRRKAWAALLRGDFIPFRLQRGRRRGLAAWTSLPTTQPPGMTRDKSSRAMTGPESSRDLSSGQIPGVVPGLVRGKSRANQNKTGRSSTRIATSRLLWISRGDHENT